MGSSRDIAIGPVAVVSLLLGTMLRDVIDPKLNPEAYRRLAFTATFFAGITQLALGFFRLGFLIDFISHAAIIGFMGGAAVTIALQQLKGLLGIKVFTKKTDIIFVMRSVFNSTEHGWNWQTIVIGLSFLAYLLLSKHIAQKKKKLFWVSAITPLTSVILATFFVYITHAEKHGVQIEYGIQTNNTVGVDKLPDEMNDMKIRDDKEIEATVVDGDGTETGHIIFTTIGGKNGQLKQAGSKDTASSHIREIRMQ